MKFIFLFVLVLFSCNANANIVIESWQEFAQLTDEGKNSDILIKGQVKDLPSNQAISSFSISFDPNQEMKIKRVVSDNNLAQSSKSAKFSFINNTLTIEFPEGKRNNEIVSIYFSYSKKYKKINQFLRQEEIYVPAFAANAKASVIFNFPGSFESATFNPNISKSGNSFIYKGIVPQSGVRETIKLTPAQSIWNVVVKSKVSAKESLGQFVIKVPIFFQSTHQQIENYNVSASVTPKTAKNEPNFTTLTFDTTQTDVLVKSSAKVTTGVDSRRAFLRDSSGYLGVGDADSKLLLPLLQQIQIDPKYGNIPLYAKIGEFVNKFITYDINYVGKLPKLTEVVQNRVGVCTEYSRLFEKLARLAGIPAIAVDGIACGEYNECQGHSWNMIYYNNQWREVDPTWNLMSGIVSSSHVYLNDYNKGTVAVEYFSNSKGEKITTAVDLEMSSLTQN